MNNIGLGTIIFLFVVVWQVISFIVQSAEKRKKQEREMDLSRKRQESSSSFSGQQASVSSTSSRPQGVADRIRSRAEELAARRQAQLEELRRRRAGSTSGTQRSTQVRAGTPSTSSSRQVPQAMPPQRSGQIKTRKAGLDNLHRQQEMESRKKAELARRRKLEAQAGEEVQARRQAVEEARVLAERKQFSKKAEAGHGTSLADHRSRREADIQKKLFRGIKKSDLISKLQQRETIRELFVLKELLDPPVGLRSQEL